MSYMLASKFFSFYILPNTHYITKVNTSFTCPFLVREATALASSSV